MTSDPPVTVSHIRAARLCTKGARTWFARHGIAWSDVLSHGVPSSVLAATGDPLAARVVAEARKETERG